MKSSPRASSPLPDALKSAHPIEADLPSLLQGRKFVEAMTTLQLCGRGTKTARLCAAILKDSPDALTPEVALAGLSAAFFELETSEFAKVYAAALPLIRGNPADLDGAKDMIWHALFRRGNDMTELEADLLAQSLRKGCLVRDSAEAARAVSRTKGREAARAVIAQALAMAEDAATREEIAKWAP